MVRLSHDDRSAINRLYAARMGRYEHGDPMRAGWSTRESQEARWDVLFGGALADMFGTDTVLDVGCGDGDLADYESFDRYVGIDVCSAQIAHNQIYHPCYREFACAEIFDLPPDARFDYVVCSGALNFKLVDTDNVEYARATLSAMYDRCYVMASCNFTGRMAETHYEKNWYYDPWEMLEFARTICDSVSLEMDGRLPNEFTLRLRR